MAAKTKGPPALPPDQLDVARALYLRRGATPKWVASQLDPPAHWRSIESAARDLGWKDERAEREAARVRRSKRAAEDQAALEVEQDERHAAQARRVLDLREMLIERAFQDVQAMKPAEARRALRDLDSLKDLQFVERFARGRSTDKTEVQESQEAYQATLDRMIAAGLLKADDAPTTDTGAVPGVEPGQGMDPPPGATPRT